MERAFKLRDYESETEVSGKVNHLYFGSQTFTAGILAADSGPAFDRDVKFSVKGLVAEGDQITMHGAWTRHAKYGWQFVAERLTYPMPPATPEGIAAYIANNPAFRGIGPVKAAAIAAECGASFDQIIRNDPDRIAKIGKLKSEQVETIRQEWIARSAMNGVGAWLAGFGLTHCQITRLIERYGDATQSVLTNDPYVLCTDLHGYGFARTDEVALKMGTPKDHPGRIAACLIDIVRREADEGGHTYVLRSSLVRAALNKLACDTLDAEARIRERIKQLAEDSNPSLVVVEGDDGIVRIAVTDIYRKEMDIVNWFAESKSNPPALAKDPFIVNDLIAQATSTQSATQAQQEALTMALTSRIGILSGGAGTGKSYTIAALRRAIMINGGAVAMCAPTGKAAKRMSQLCGGAEASTIHRLLGYNPGMGGFTYDSDNKLSYDLVIVDEVSMCDVRLLWSLFSAIDLRSTQVLLVGDHNQLPPIGAGNTLRDALAVQAVPSYILRECHRAAGQLKVNCNDVLAGKMQKSSPSLPAGGREWYLIDSLEDPELVMESLRMLMRERFVAWGYHPLRESQIITPQNRGPLGVLRINAEMQRIWQSQEYGVELPAVPADDKAIRLRLLAGDKIIQTKNNYKLDVMNGTQGVIDRIEIEGKASYYLISFDDKAEPCRVEVGSEEAKDVQLAYAVTCHRMQGSECPCVVAIIHKQHTYMLSRNLAYTAVTRARKTAVVIGDKLGIRRALANVDSGERRTWMGLAAQQPGEARG